MELTVVKQNGEVLCKRCALADTPYSRFRGLMGRRGLDDDEGMLLVTSSIHTSFMRFPIDAVFLDRSFTVVRIKPALKPWRVAIAWSAHAVIELPAGTAAHAGLEPGEQLSLVAQPGEASSRSDQPLPGTVAIASSDSRFLRVFGFLLERHGFEVETFRDAMDVIPKAQGRFAVVVVDGSASISAAARMIRGLSAESPSTGVVVVGDVGNGAEADDAQPQTLHVLPKWDAFDEVVHEIQLASRKRNEYELA
jgi:uncharacterized membrane protein (UPF0127 family)/ActR/RegA family two-component response regulator